MIEPNSWDFSPTLPPPSEKAASFFHQYRDVVLVEVGAEGLPVARFQRLSGGAVFPEQDHAAIQAFCTAAESALISVWATNVPVPCKHQAKREWIWA